MAARRNILKTSILSGLMLSFIFCDKKGTEEPDDECISAGISITEDAKYYRGIVWKWNTTYEGNLNIIAIKDDCDDNLKRNIELYIKKKCPEIIESYYASCSCDSDFDLSCISSDYTYYDTNLKIQKWVPGKLIIGTNAGTDFWVELNENNKFVRFD